MSYQTDAINELWNLIDTKLSLLFSEEPNGVLVLVVTYNLVMMTPVFLALATGKYQKIPASIAGGLLRCLMSLFPIIGVPVAVAHLIRDVIIVMKSEKTTKSDGESVEKPDF